MDRELRANNRHRPPNWRWQRITQLVERRGRISQRRDDEWIVEGRKFLTAANRCQTDEEHIDLAYAAPERYEIWALYEGGKQTEQTRGAIEARLLAREDVEEIARKTGYPAKAIELYHHWFFDVRDRLAHPDLITTCVFGKSIQAGLSERDFDLLWKLYGYAGGGELLDMVINKFAPAGSAKRIVAFLQDDFMATLALKGNIAMRTMPISYQTQLEIANLWMRLREMENKDGGGTGGGAEGILQATRQFFAELPWQKASKATPSNNELLETLDRSSISVRAHEITLIGTGQQTPFMQQLMESAEGAYFPGGEAQDGNQQNDA